MTDADLLFYLLAIAGLLIFSGFFSGSETGLTAISRARVHKLAMDGNRRARLVGHLRKQKENLIGAILLGNNLVNIAASALATSMFIQVFGEEGVAYATLVMTLLVLIFAEVLPKTYAIIHPERVALAVAPIFTVLIPLLSPITRAIHWIVRMTFRLFGVELTTYPQLISASEALRGAIQLHHEEGEMVKLERDMLGGVLDLGEIEVGEIMEHRKNVFAVNIDLSTGEIVDEVLGARHSRIPFWKDSPDEIVGVLHVRDLMKELKECRGDLEKVHVGELLKEPWFVPETTSLRDQLIAFRRKQSHLALVVDEYGVFQGLVTLEDIIEEIVGQIQDEYDESYRRVRKQKDGSYLVEGSMTIRDLNRYLDWNLPDEHASTVAGLLIHAAEAIPEEGEEFTFHNCRFRVMRKEENQLTSLRIQPLPKEDEEEY